MASGNTRKIVKIDEEKCNGCGLCVPSCAEGALQIIDGKARLISEKYCDGLGACLGECPQGAISIEERPAEEFNEAATAQHLADVKIGDDKLACGCASAAVSAIDRDIAVTTDGSDQPSTLGHWPVQLTLVSPGAPFLEGADVLLAADCAPFAYANFHRDFIRDKAVLVACPKLDDFAAHQARLAEILKQSDIKTLTVVHMEVPCCSGLMHLARQALLASEKQIPLREVTIGMNGDIL